MGTVRDLIHYLVRYGHDFAAALWVALLLVHATYRRATGRTLEAEKARAVRNALRASLTPWFWTLLVLVLGLGGARAALYTQAEWDAALGAFQWVVLGVKHVLFLALVAAGLILWRRWGRADGGAALVLGAALLLAGSGCTPGPGAAGEGTHVLGWERPIQAGSDVLFRDLDYACFYEGSGGRSLRDLGGPAAEGCHGWNIDSDDCPFDGVEDLVECSEVGNYALVRFAGARVHVRLGMDFYGDEVRAVLDPGTPAERDLGTINTCADLDTEQRYPGGRQPLRRIRQIEHPDGHWDHTGRYVQGFLLAEDLPDGPHVLRLEHVWEAGDDPRGSDFVHLHSIQID